MAGLGKSLQAKKRVTSACFWLQSFAIPTFFHFTRVSMWATPPCVAHILLPVGSIKGSIPSRGACQNVISAVRSPLHLRAAWLSCDHWVNSKALTMFLNQNNCCNLSKGEGWPVLSFLPQWLQQSVGLWCHTSWGLQTGRKKLLCLPCLYKIKKPLISAHTEWISRCMVYIAFLMGLLLIQWVKIARAFLPK